MKTLHRNGYYIVEFNNNKDIVMVDGPHSTPKNCANVLKVLKLLSLTNTNSTYKMIKVETIPQDATVEVPDEVITICRRIVKGVDY